MSVLLRSQLSAFASEAYTSGLSVALGHSVEVLHYFFFERHFWKCWRNIIDFIKDIFIISCSICYAYFVMAE